VPRRPRDSAAGIFHVWVHCVWAVDSHFRDDLDRIEFLRLLAEVTRKVEWKCVAFCLMTSHYHLIVDVDDGVLPAAMHRLNLGYVRNFNRRHALRGRGQSHPYGAGRIFSNEHLLDRFAYVALNPVRAGLCRRPGDWKWSSYAGTVGLGEPHSFVDDSPLLRALPRSEVDPRAALRALVEKP
jgi:putative transposase